MPDLNRRFLLIKFACLQEKEESLTESFAEEVKVLQNEFDLEFANQD